MPDIFGIDLAGILNENLGPGLVDLTVTKYTAGTRTPGNLAGGTNPTTETGSGKGILEANADVDGDVIQRGIQISVLGASLPSGMVIEPEDTITIEGNVYRVVRLRSRDPAAALYVYEVQA